MTRRISRRSVGIYFLALLATLFFASFTLWIPGVLEPLHDEYFRFFRPFVYFGFQLTPTYIIGDIILIALLVIAARGIYNGNYQSSILSSFLYFMPTFLNFAAGMTCLFAGIEVLGYFAESYIGVESTPRFIVSRLYNVGRVFFVPYWMALDAVAPSATAQWDATPIVRDAYGGAFVVVGLLTLFLGVAAWLNSKYEGRDIAVSGIYRLSRHPQYLGYILWSYGVLILTTFRQHPMRYPLSPTINWFLSSLILIGLAYREEIDLRKDEKINYSEYYHRVSFLIPVLGPVRRSLSIPIRVLWRGEYPDNMGKVLATLILLFLVLSIPEMFFGGLYQYWNPYF